MAEPTNVADELAVLLGDGVYDIALVTDKFGRWGFDYDPERDELVHVESGRRARLGARPASVARVEVANNARDRDEFGWMSADTPDAMLLVDALSLGQAVYLTLTGKPPPSLGYTSRPRGFKADVKAITKHLAQN